MTTESSRTTTPQGPPEAVALPMPQASQGARRAPQINVSCCAPGSSCSADAPPAKAAATPHAHKHGAEGHDHQDHDGHGHGAQDGPDGHDHGALPGRGRIGASRAAALPA